ncbi:MAG: heavy metal-associated domain-containing protein [bacterium]
MTTETRLKIEGMGCGSCVQHVGDALRGQPGVQQVDVQLAEGAPPCTTTAPI